MVSPVYPSRARHRIVALTIAVRRSGATPRLRLIHSPRSRTHYFLIGRPIIFAGELTRQANVFELFRAGSASRGPREAQLRGANEAGGPLSAPGGPPPPSRRPLGFQSLQIDGRMIGERHR